MLGQGDWVTGKCRRHSPHWLSGDGTVTDCSPETRRGGCDHGPRFDVWGESVAATDAAGHFRLVVPEGSYDFLAEAKERVSIAVTGREYLAGEKLGLPAFKLIGGGFISGQVVNTATGVGLRLRDGEPIMLGLFGPSQPPGPVSLRPGWPRWTGRAGSPCVRPRGKLPLLREYTRRGWPGTPASNRRSS